LELNDQVFHNSAYLKASQLSQSVCIRTNQVVQADLGVMPQARAALSAARASLLLSGGAATDVPGSQARPAGVRVLFFGRQ